MYRWYVGDVPLKFSLIIAGTDKERLCVSILRINERATCDAQWEWHERATFEKMQTK